MILEKRINNSFSKPRRVVVALRMAGIAGQDKLTGIFEYQSAGRRWQLIIYRTKEEFTREVVEQELARGADGFIIGIPGIDDVLTCLAKTNTPLVLLNTFGGCIKKSRKNIVFVKSSSEDIGRTAAHTLIRQGIYKSYGYVGYRTDEDWSRLRGKFFAETLAEAGFSCTMFDFKHYHHAIEDKSTIVKWLTDLPKPCGLLAACDDRAFEIIDICNEIGIAIPAKIGILGVNNDAMLCENSEPQLSSIQPNFIEEGRLAAELLDRMISGHDIFSKNNFRQVGVRDVILRASTVAQSESGKLIQKVIAYIGREALKGITVSDVAKHFNVSRSLLDLRFHELQNESIYEAMLRIRLEEVKRMLRNSTTPISEITRLCGWANLSPPKVLFKKRYGMTMREYRSNSNA